MFVHLCDCLFACLFICMFIGSCVCLLQSLPADTTLTFITVQDVLVTDFNRFTAKVQSLEDKYVRFLYKKVAALEKCNPCDPQSGKHYYYKCIM